MLPDLTAEITDLQFSTNSNDEQLLRFGTGAVNLGAGALELRGQPPVNGMQDVYQRIFDSAGGYTERYAGTFVYSGGRVRFDESADYFLREANADGSSGGVLGSNVKVAYCLVDSHQASSSPSGTPGEAQYGGALYPACGQIMGISVGWVDLYPAYFGSQIINLTGISSGTYWLENVIDPANRFQESDETNNSSRVSITIATTFSPEINLLGNGQSIDDQDLLPASTDHTDFGYVDVASGSVTRAFTIQNPGNGTLSLTGVPRVQVLGSSDFAVTAQPFSPVTNGGSTTFQITFDPSGMNATAEVFISNNDANEGLYRFAIQGNANSGSADADLDGMPDAWEALYNLNDAAGDEDGDGVSNLDEFMGGTSPRDPNSVFRIKSAGKIGETVEVAWESVRGRTYKLYFASDSAALSNPGLWQFLAQYPGTGALITAPGGRFDEQRFYRVTAEF